MSCENCKAAESALAAVRALVGPGPANPRSATAGSPYSTGRWDAFAEVRAVLESEVEDGVFGDPEIHARLTRAALAHPHDPRGDAAVSGPNERVQPPGSCWVRGDWGDRCTEDRWHRWSHYDASSDTSWNDHTEDHADGCTCENCQPDDNAPERSRR